MEKSTLGSFKKEILVVISIASNPEDPVYIPLSSFSKMYTCVRVYL